MGWKEGRRAGEGRYRRGRTGFASTHRNPALGYRIPGVRPVKPEHFAASGFEKDTALIFRPARGCDGPYDASAWRYF